ncbi:MAG: leucine-rich repeat protein [Eubacterium sp.]|nr:leucine-rich repeat protein [Eubacterium sp.]
MSILYEIRNQEIAVTGYDGAVTWLQIPETIEGKQVTCIAHSAFAHRPELRYVSLPAGMRRLERFAFYDCRQLERITLYDGIRDYYDGVIGQCRHLEEIELNLSGGHYNVLRDLLGDSDQLIRFTLKFPDGTAKLTFPDYLTEYHEDTRARAIHIHIEGAGFSYRETVSRTGIDFRGFDRLFERIRYQEAGPAVQTSLDRLCFPYALEEPEAEQYRQFLQENAEETVREVVRRKERTWLAYLLEHGLLGLEAIQTGIRLASQADAAELVAMLMAAARPAAPPRFEL